MISLEAKFSEVYENLNQAQRTKFDSWLKEARGKYGERKHKVTIEMQIAAAERIAGSKLTTESIRESGRGTFEGRRNNGTQEPVSNEAKMRQESDALLYKYLGIPIKEAVPQAVRESKNPFAEADYKFALAIGLKESDAIKVASDQNTLRPPKDRMVIKD